MKTLVLAAFVAALAGPALAQQTAAPGVHASAKGDVLADAHGMTLYVFAKDAPGRSACSGACAVNWPPAAATAEAQASGAFSIIVRDDGARQWAHEGRPLYTWSKDQAPGDITGDGFLNGAWHLAMP